jgi:hypothetical protein
VVPPNLGATVVEKKRRPQLNIQGFTMPVILTLGRLRQEDRELKTSLGYLRRYCLKKLFF